MKQILQYSIIIAMLLLVSTQADAQRYRRTGSISFGGQVLQPLGSFANQYNGYPAGLGGTLSIPIRHSAFEIGGGYAWNSMGSQNQDINVFITTDKDGDDIYAKGKLRIRSSINRYQTFARLRPLTGMIQPYGDLIAGVDVFKTNNDITIDSEGYSQGSNSKKDHQDVAFEVGWAAGLRIRLAPNVFFEGRFENISSGKVTYVDQNSIVVKDDNTLSFDTKESKANRYTYQIGIALTF